MTTTMLAASIFHRSLWLCRFRSFSVFVLRQPFKSTVLVNDPLEEARDSASFERALVNLSSVVEHFDLPVRLIRLQALPVL